MPFLPLFILCSVVFGVSSQNLDNLLSASLALLKTLHEDDTYFFTRCIIVCVQNQTTLDPVHNTFWKNSISIQSFVDDEWLLFIQKMPDPYRQVWTFLFIGDHEWIMKMMQKTNEFIYGNKMNVYQTLVILIQTTYPSTSLAEATEFSISLHEQLQIVLLQEMKRKILPNSSPTMESRDVTIYSSRWNPPLQVALENIGWWSKYHGLQLTEPVYRAPLNHYNGREIAITALHKPGVFEFRNSDGQPYKYFAQMKGYVKEITSVVIDHLRLTPKIIETVGFGSRPDENGSWSGLMGDITKKKADFSPLDFIASVPRFKVADFSVYIGDDPVLLISQGPRPLVQPFMLLQIFQPITWISLVIAIVGCGVIMITFEWILNYTIQQNSNASMKYFSSVYKIFISQSNAHISYWSSGRVFATFVFFVGIIIFSLYRGSVTSYLAVPRRSKPIDSPEDLMQNLDNKIPVARKNTIYYQFIEHFDYYAPIAAKLTIYDATFLNTLDFFSLINEGQYVLIDTASSGLGRRARFETPSEECKYHVSKNAIVVDLDVMIHQRNSVFKESIDKILQRIQDTGVVLKIKQDHYARSCKHPSGRLDLKPMSLIQFQSPFYVLAFGLGASMITFLVELLVNLLQQETK